MVLEGLIKELGMVGKKIQIIDGPILFDYSVCVCTCVCPCISGEGLKYVLQLSSGWFTDMGVL